MRAAGLVFAVVLAATPALGDDTDDPFAEGLALQRAGHFAAALTAFQRAQVRHPSPETKLHMAECEVGTGRWLRAEAHLREVSADPNEVGATAKAELAALAPRIPRLRIVVLPFDEEARALRVEIDGDAIAERPPTTVRVDPGVHRVVATSSSHERAAETVEAKDGETTAVTLALMPGPQSPSTWRTSLHRAGFALIGTGAATAALGTGLLFFGAVQNFCLRFGTSECPHEGDGLLIAGGLVVLVSVGSFVTAGILFGVSARQRPPAEKRHDPELPDSEVFGAELRVPTWYDGRPPVPSMPTVVTVFSRTF